MVFADEHATYGVLTLLRAPELGLFTSGEVRALTFALDGSSQTLADARISKSAANLTGVELTIIEPAPLESARLSATEWAMYVLDANLQIVHSSPASSSDDPSLTAVDTCLTNRLPRVIEEAVRELTASWTVDPKTRLSGVSRPMPFLTVSTQPLFGATEMGIGVLVQRFRTRSPLRTAVQRFSVSPRETQVLALLLNGDTLNEIAAALHITSSTVQDHIKSLMQRTETHGRAEMIARILGWRTAP
jgi:DNA-binding CsgD family transcriptional regulator